MNKLHNKLHGKAEITIPLGYEMPTGDRVDVPLRHMAVTGQTQRSGKTTTLEGLIGRSGVTALAFITKRGEGSFTAAHRVPVYFEDGAGGRPYWEFVESIVASTMGQKMKFERAWIVKASKGATTLQQVRVNVGKLQLKATRSMDQDIYMLLAEYLDIVLPQIEQHKFARSLTLRPGLNVMDLTDFSEEMQMLVVRACLIAIHKHSHNVVTIIPEAWKFVPEARMTPVKPAAERLVREGAGLGNFVWIDSQDIAGVSKLLLRACTVWIIGVQREANELRRTLSNIPEGIRKPRAGDVATLGIGQFFACYDDQTRKTYVQPAWMSATDAGLRAMGIGIVDGVDMQAIDPHEVTELGIAQAMSGIRLRKEISVAEAREMFPPAQRQEDEPMTPAAPTDKYAAMTWVELRAVVDDLNAQLIKHHAKGRSDDAPLQVGRASLDDLDTVYQMVKTRLIADAPALLKLITLKPEIEVSVRREVIKMDTDSLDGRIAVLISDGFFDDVKPPAATLDELAKRGWRSIHPRLSESFSRMTKRGFLYKLDNGYQAVAGMKVNVVSAD